MDFIERFPGNALDGGGSGIEELGLVLAPILPVALIVGRHHFSYKSNGLL